MKILPYATALLISIPYLSHAQRPDTSRIPYDSIVKAKLDSALKAREDSASKAARDSAFRASVDSAENYLRGRLQFEIALRQRADSVLQPKNGASVYFINDYAGTEGSFMPLREVIGFYRKKVSIKKSRNSCTFSNRISNNRNPLSYTPIGGYTTLDAVDNSLATDTLLTRLLFEIDGVLGDHVITREEAMNLRNKVLQENCR